MSNLFAIFSAQSDAQNAANEIWALMPHDGDVDAATGVPIVPQVTNAWTIPWQRATDNAWVVELNPDYVTADQGTWTIQAFDPSWYPAGE